SSFLSLTLIRGVDEQRAGLLDALPPTGPGRAWRLPPNRRHPTGQMPIRRLRALRAHVFGAKHRHLQPVVEKRLCVRKLLACLSSLLPAASSFQSNRKIEDLWAKLTDRCLSPGSKQTERQLSPLRWEISVAINDPLRI